MDALRGRRPPARSTRRSTRSPRDNVSRLNVAWRWASPDNAARRRQPAGAARDVSRHAVDGAAACSTPSPRSARWPPSIPAPGRRDGCSTPRAGRPAAPATWASCTAGSPTHAIGDEERLLLGTGDAYLLVGGCPQPGSSIARFGDGGRVDLMAGVAQAVRATNYAVSAAPIVCPRRHRGGIQHPRRADPQGVAARRRLRLRPADRDDGCGRCRRSRRRASSAPTRGSATRPPTPAARTSGRTCPRTRSSGSSTCRSARRPTTSTAGIVPATTCSPRAWSRSTRAPASEPGTSRWSITACGTTICRPRHCLVDLRVDGREVKAVVQVSKQGFTYVFDRRTGKPGLADRGAAGAAVHGAGRAHLGRRSRFPLRPPPFERQGLTDEDLIDFTPELRAQAQDRCLGVRPRAALHAAVRARRGRPARMGGRRELGRRRPWTRKPASCSCPRSRSPSVLQLVKPDPATQQLALPAGRHHAAPAHRRSAGRQATVQPRHGHRPEPRRAAVDVARLATAHVRHPRLAHLTFPPLGAGARGAPLVTRTLLFVAMGQGGLGEHADRARSATSRSALRCLPKPPKLVAFDKATGAQSCGRPRPRAGRSHRR